MLLFFGGSSGNRTPDTLIKSSENQISNSFIEILLSFDKSLNYAEFRA